ncbi:MAG: DUF4177 domain-containing protein [Anaerolineales bacterium]|nr:DUF4177 domain-containing protein [Anaerolineales bacterium]
MDETPKWEYRVDTFGGILRHPKDKEIEATLNEWGTEGWEVVSAIAPDNSSAVRVIAKRPLSRRESRQRNWPA